MATHQSKIAIADGGPVVTTSRRPPMTSKQAKKAFAKANNIPKMSWKERKRMEAAELAAQKREFEREKAQAKARALKAKKDAKEEAEKAERKKAGIPEKSRWVRPSQGKITGFLGLGKRGRSKDIEEEEEDGDDSDDDCEEPVSKKVALDEAEDDTEEEGIEEREVRISEPPAIQTVCDTTEREGDVQSDRHEPPEEVSVVATERKCSPEAEPEAEIQHGSEEPELEVKREPVARSEPEVQPGLEDEPETELDQEDQPDRELQARSEDQAESTDQEEQDLQAKPEVETEPKTHRVLDGRTESEDHAVPRLDDPKLPTNNQYVTSSQDFMEDDDIFLELAAAHQLLSESFDAGVRSQAAAQSSPVLETKETTGTPSSPKQQPVSPVLERTLRPRIEFGGSAISPQPVSYNSSSRNQPVLRPISKPNSKPNTTAVASVMGPPTSIIRPQTSSTRIRSQTKNMPAPTTNSPLSGRTARGAGAIGPGQRRPLNDISRHVQNVQSEAVASFSRLKQPHKSSVLPAHTTPKVSPFALPTSTQLFLADHLDDFFPSPSQELRELLEDIEDDDIPSNTQVAREIGRDSIVVRPVLVEPAQPELDDDFPWTSSRDFMFSSQELRELESPTKVSSVPAPPPTPWDVRRARKPRFFVEKEEDLFAAAIHESKLQGKADDEAAKLRLENMRIERELLGTRQSSQRSTRNGRRPSQDAYRLEAGPDDVSEQLEGLNASQLVKLMDGIESDEYGDDFDDEEVEASMIAFGHKLENPFARDYESEFEFEFESESESEIETRRQDSLLQDVMNEAHGGYDYGCL